MITIHNGEIQKIVENTKYDFWGRKQSTEKTLTTLKLQNEPFVKSDEQDTDEGKERDKELRSLFLNSNGKLDTMRENISAIMVAAGQLERLSTKGA